MTHRPFRNLLSLAIAVLGTTGTAGPALARLSYPLFVPVGIAADPPKGFVTLCERDRGTCLAGMGSARLPAAPRGGDWLRIAGIRSGLAGTQPHCTAPSDAFDPRINVGLAVTRVAAAWPAVRCGGGSLPTSFAVVGQPAAMDATAMKQLVARTNRDVNRAVIERTDLDARGVEEDWRRPDAARPVGDCEDIAIEKRMRLVAQGFPPGRLFYGVAYRSGVGLHVVLIARLDTGDVVLDNLSPHVLAWSATRYRWLRFQSPEDPTVWQTTRPGGGSVI